jgi:glycosyltransferase involved in cell wall biosynthesis
VRILYFHQHFTTPGGAGGTRSFEFASRLARAGHEVIVVCGSYQGGDTGLSGDFKQRVRRGRVSGFEVIEYQLPYSNKLSFVARTRAFLRFAKFCSRIALTQKVDVVYATSTPLTVAIPGILARWFRGVPFVFEVRDLWPELPKAMGVIKNPVILSAMSALEWTAYKSAHHCIGLSPGIKQGIVKHGIAEDRVALIPNSADIDTFRPDVASRLDVPGIEPGDTVALFTGTHGPANGLDGVLDVAAVLKGRGRRDIKLVFIGDGKLKKALVGRAEQEGLDNCLFLDPMPKRRLAAVVAGADIGLMILANVPAFYYGTSPNKFFDYLSAGVPVLVNYPGWLADLVNAHECGIAVPPENPIAFAKALERLADDPDLRKRMGKRGRTLAETEYSRDEMGKRVVTVLETVGGHARA